jgi:hypothetical protein
VRYEKDVLASTLHADAREYGAQPRVPERVARERIKMGVNAFSFHPKFCGLRQTVTLYSPSGQVAVDFRELVALAEGNGIEIRESDFFRNACALFIDNRPFVVLGTFGIKEENGDPDEARGLDILVLGHEIGHHACKHTVGRLADNAWQKELEADQHGGMLVGKMFREKKIQNWNDNEEEFLNVVANGIMSGVYGSGGPTHPPAELRVKAVRDGFYGGSPCK